MSRYVKKLTQLGFSGVRDDEVYGSAYAGEVGWERGRGWT
jgi:hypothetical protein